MANEFQLPRNPYKFGSLEYDNWNYEHPEAKGGTDVALDAAKGTLSRANEFADQTGSADLAALEDRLAGLRSKPDTRGLVRRITEPLANAGQIAQAAALPASINPVIGGALGAGGTLATLPDFARRLIAPEEGEEGPGLVEGALTAASVIPSIRGLKALAADTKPFIGPLGDLEGAANIGGRARAFEDTGRVVQRGARPDMLPSQRLAGERLAASPSFAALGAKPQGPQTFADAVREAAATIKGHMIPEQGAASFADAVRAEAPIEAARTANRASVRALKTVPNAHVLDSLGLNYGQDLAVNPRMGIPSEYAIPDNPDWFANTELSIPSVKPLDAMKRLGARAKERFGKSYRSE